MTADLQRKEIVRVTNALRLEVPQSVAEDAQRRILEAFDAATRPKAGDADLLRRHDALAALKEIARLRLATNEGSLRVRADRMWELAEAALSTLQVSPPEPEDYLHTGDDGLLDALTGARTALESIAEDPDVDRDEAIQDALDELTKADKLRVSELRPALHVSSGSASQCVRGTVGCIQQHIDGQEACIRADQTD